MNLKLSKLSFIFIISTALLFSLVFSVFTFVFTDDLYESKVAKLEKEFYLKNKELIKNES
jgi:hypothetical protein